MMRMTKLLTGLLAAFTSLCALVIVIHTLLVPDGSAGWIAWKVFSSAVTLTQGTLTLHYLLSRNVPAAAHLRMLMDGGAVLIPLGTTAVVVTVHLARVTGDWEMYMIAAGLAMICQGVLTAWSLPKQMPREA